MNLIIPIITIIPPAISSIKFATLKSTVNKLSQLFDWHGYFTLTYATQAKPKSSSAFIPTQIATFLFIYISPLTACRLIPNSYFNRYVTDMVTLTSLSPTLISELTDFVDAESADSAVA